MVKVKNIITYIEGFGKKFWKDEGVKFGNSKNEVKSVLVCWMATFDAIKTAISEKSDLIITHESLWSPYNAELKKDFSECLNWEINKTRKKLLEKHNIIVVRAHSTLDNICIFDDFAKKLGLLDPSVEEDGLVKLYDIKPVSVRVVIDRVKKALNLDLVRVTPCDLNKKIKRIGLPWGGLGLFVNVGYQNKLLKHKPDLFIAGETDNYGMRFAIDNGIIMIETSHEVSENIGLRNFADRLKSKFRNIKVTFYENKRPWINC